MLESGSVDAYAGDKIKLVGLAAQAKDPAKLALLAEDLSFEPYALGAAAQRFGAAPRGQPGADADLHRRRHRDDLRPVAGQARSPVRPARRHVSAERDPRVIAPTADARRTSMVKQLRTGLGTFAAAAVAILALAGCNTPPAYQVSEQPMARVGTVESIQQHAVQNVPNAVGAIGGALIGGGLGSLIGGGTARRWRRSSARSAAASLGNELAQPRPDDGVGDRRALRRRQLCHDPANRRARPAHRRSRARHRRPASNCCADRATKLAQRQQRRALPQRGEIP